MSNEKETDFLKHIWKSAGTSSRESDELKSITKTRYRSHVIRIRARLSIEVLLLSVFIVFYYDFLDGASRPMLLNLIVVVSAMAYVFVRIYSFFSLSKPVLGPTVRSSLQAFMSTLKRIMLWSMVSSIVLSAALIVFLTHGIRFDAFRYTTLVCILIGFAIMHYTSYRTWRYRIDHIRGAIFALNDHE